MATIDQSNIDAILKKGGYATSNEQKELEVSLEDVDSFGNKESLKECFVDIAKYNKMLGQRITLVNDSLTTAIPFTRENLYLFCAYSGNGKSTLAANISFPLWKQEKKTLVISNEEPKQDILFRIGCLELGYSFNDYKKGRMPIALQKEVVKLFPAISQYVKILDVNYKNGLTTKVEGIKNALTAVQDADFSCVMIDYFQLIKNSIEKGKDNTYDNLNNLRIWLGQYIKRSNIPIVMFAQLHSIGKRNNKDLDSRIKHCPDIYEPSTVVIEVIPNFDEHTSDFYIHKDRFGLAGHRIICGFENGRYIDMTTEFGRQVTEEKLKQLQDKIGNEQ